MHLTFLYDLLANISVYNKTEVVEFELQQCRNTVTIENGKLDNCP